MDYSFTAVIEKLNELSDAVQQQSAYAPVHTMERLVSEIAQIIVVLAQRAGEDVYGSE